MSGPPPSSVAHQDPDQGSDEAELPDAEGDAEIDRAEQGRDGGSGAEGDQKEE